MSIPTSKMLGVSKGFLAIAKLKNNSPSQSQNVCVNVQLPPEKPVLDQKDIDQKSPPDKNNNQESTQSSPTTVSYSDHGGDHRSLFAPTDSNPYTNLKERSLETANITKEELSNIIDVKDKICQALLLMLDIVEHNPLIVNKYIIAEAESLKELVLLLTNGDEVSIQSDFDVGCTCGSNKYVNVDKIFVKKNDETFNFKYAFPEALKILDDHKISIKFCI